MHEFERVEPFQAAGEREMLVTWLDYHRATVLLKIDGLGDEAGRRLLTLSGLSLLGLVKHLAYVERWWFQSVFAGREVAYPMTDDDPDAEFRIEPHESTADIIELYRQEVRTARQIMEAAGLDDVARNSGGRRSGHTMRWIIVHMIEETARHNGHSDILREMIDGVTGV